MKFRDVRDAVAQYIERGFRPIPLFGVGPSGCNCGGFCKDRDWGKHEPPDTDGRWKEGRQFGPLNFNPEDNVALAMGPWKQGRWLVALDTDGTDDLGVFFPSMPKTLTQSTPRGGRHYVYTVPEYTALGNWIDVFRTKRGGFSLDIRYARGRIVVAPSRGATGDYQWIDWRQPAPLPSHALLSIATQRRDAGKPMADRWERGDKDP